MHILERKKLSDLSIHLKKTEKGNILNSKKYNGGNNKDKSRSEWKKKINRNDHLSQKFGFVERLIKLRNPWQVWSRKREGTCHQHQKYKETSLQMIQILKIEYVKMFLPINSKI